MKIVGTDNDKCNVCEKQNELYFLLTCSTSIINHADVFFLVGLEEEKNV
jgi:hypothetical protein